MINVILENVSKIFCRKGGRIMKRKFGIFTVFAVIFSLLIPTSFASAASTTYNSTYDIANGVYGKQVTTSNSPTVTVTITPTSGYSDVNLCATIQRKGLVSFGDVTSEKCVNSGKGGTLKFATTKGDGTYRLYLYNYSGLEVKGKITVKYAW